MPKKRFSYSSYNFSEEQDNTILNASSPDGLVGHKLFKGVPRWAIRRRKHELLNEFSESKQSFSANQDGAVATLKTTNRITTLEQLIKACNIDTEVWYVDKFVINKWEVARKQIKQDINYRVINSSSVKEGYSQDTGQMYVQDLWQVKAWLKPVNPACFDSKKFREDLLNDTKAFIENKYSMMPAILYEPLDEEDDLNMVMLNFFDMHYDKLAWRFETGEDWDSKISKQEFIEAKNWLLSQVIRYKIDEIWMPVGNDFFNSDKAYPFTATTKGTPQESDGRWQKVFREGRQLIADAIIELSTIAPVKVPVIPGNHDFERVFYLGDSLECFFYTNPNVTIINSPNPRQYHSYYDNLFGFTHGSNEKASELHQIMSMEADNWSTSKYKHLLLGHIHHEKIIQFISTVDYKGLKIEYLPSLTAPDAWHHSKGFIGTVRGAQAYVHNASRGRIATFPYNV